MTVTDDLWTAVANERRRMAIRALHDLGSTTLRELADAVSEREYGPTYRSNERKCVYTALYQSHLEKLAAADIIQLGDHPEDFHRRDSKRTIQPGAQFDAAQELIHAADVATGQTKPLLARLASGFVTGVTG